MEIRAKFWLPIIAISRLFAKQTAVSTTAKIFYIISPCIFPMPGTKEHIYKVLHEFKNTTWHASADTFWTQKSVKYIYIWSLDCIVYTLCSHKMSLSGTLWRWPDEQCHDIKHIRLDLGDLAVFWLLDLPGSVCVSLAPIFSIYRAGRGQQIILKSMKTLKNLFVSDFRYSKWYLHQGGSESRNH